MAELTADREVLREFLSFRLGAEEYGIEILKVQEIRGWEQPTVIANTTALTSRDMQLVDDAARNA